MNFSKMKPIIYTFTFFLVTLSSGISRADDTEIYFTNTNNASVAAIRPNVLLILDSSGSMGWTSGTFPDTRMEVMREAMLEIINNMEDVNVGLMRFQYVDGGSVLFPITYIDDPAANVSSEPDDANPTVNYTITSGDNDAEQNGTTVSLSEPSLEIPSTEAIATAGTVTRQISASFDDAVEYFGTMYLNLNNYLGTNLFNAVRFTDINIPQGATIDDARLTFIYRNRSSTSAPDSTISAEDVDDSQAFSISNFDITTRSRTTSTITWNAAANPAFGDTEQSPDFSSEVKKIIDRTGWEAGNALSIITHSASSGFHRYESYENDPTKAPILSIDYSGVTAVAATDQRVALRYPTVDIPKGATITSAKLTFTSRSNSATDGAAWLIRAENTDTSAALAASANNLSGRTPTTAQVAWTVPVMTSNTGYTSCASGTCVGDLKTVVQEVVDRDGWCGGNAMSFLIDKSVAGTRKIHSFESDSTLSPTLEITYDASTGGCYRKTETAQVSANYDDAEELSNGTMDRTDGDLDLSEKKVGIRFLGIDVPKGSTILSAFLEVYADGASTENPNPTVTITGDDVDNSAQFSSTTNDITDRSDTTASVNWALGDFITDNEVQTSPDIETIVKEIVDRTGWASGNAMSFIFNDDRRTRAIESYDGDPNQAARLTITYESNTPAAVSQTTVRERLIELVNQIPTSGGTPIVETLYEAAHYWRGESIVYGDERDGVSSTRLSHPGSYCSAAGACNGATVNGTSPVTDSFGVFTPTGCPTSNLNDSDCVNRTIEGSPIYISPFNTSLTCQNNYQVLLTDGDANNSSIASTIKSEFGISSCATTRSDGTSVPSGEECGVELTKFMFENDQNTTLDNDQVVTTYTIGFNTTGLAGAKQFLEDVADDANGSFFEATSAADLVSVFDTILSDVKSDPTSFVAPSLATNAFNRLLSRDEVYFGLFTPSYDQSWPGNVKKYNICVSSGGEDEDILTTSDNCTLGAILDDDKIDAIDSTTNKFKDTATSIWSDVVDGRATQKGGAGGEIVDYTTRIIYTDQNASGIASNGDSLALADNPGFQFDEDTWDDTGTGGLDLVRALVCPTPSTTAASDCEDRMLWMLGKIFDADADTDTSATTRWSDNDVLHSSPAVITYGGTDDDNDGTSGEAEDSDGVTDFFFDRLVVGTNDGGLRFINGTTGKEEWEFMPMEVLDRQPSLFTNAESDHIYGLDVTPAIRVIDVDADGFIEPADGDLVHVYIGMRRGGDFIYALDVTPTSTLANNTTAIPPKFLWRISSATTGFGRLGQTWSPPRIATISLTGGNSKDVLIFGGGYDSDLDSLDNGGAGPDRNFGLEGGAPNMGNAIYIVDPDDGSLVLSISHAADAGNGIASGSGADIEVPNMFYSITSRITILDTDGDGLDDRLYFGDKAGQVWRVDLGEDVALSGGSPEGETVVGRLANISTAGTLADERRFFEPPAVVQVKDTIFSDAANGEFDYVLIGSGNRADPLDKDVNNRFYAFRDKFIDAMPDTDGSPDNLADSSYPQSGGPITTANMIDITSTVLDSTDTTHVSSLGWYFDFDASGSDGEKVLSAPTAVAGGVFFTTYLPEASSTDLCSANIGGGNAYNFNILTTKAALDWDEDGTLEDTADRKTSLGGGIPSDVVPIFTKEGVVAIVGIEGGAAQLGQLTGLPRYRTYWYEE
jgi:type IV pilus assembly protein PilY1